MDQVEDTCFIAMELVPGEDLVQAILPDIVREDGDGTLAVAYTQMVPLLVEALQEPRAGP